MNISLSPKLKQFVDRKVKAGAYASAEDVVRAAVERFMQEDFAPGELAALVAVGEAELQRGDVIDGEEVFAEMREMRKPSQARLRFSKI